MPTLSWRAKKYLTLQLERFRRWKAAAGNSPAMRDAKRNQESTPKFPWAKAVGVLLFVAYSAPRLLSSGDGGDDRSGLHVTRKVDTFTVTGSRLEDLSPNPESGNLETWVRWSLEKRDEGEGCRPGRVLVTVDLTYNLPQWSSVPNAERDRWNQFLEEQRTYLDYAADIWVDSGQERVEAMRELGTYASCDELDAATRRTIDTIHDRSSARHRNLLETLWALGLEPEIP